jgi:metal-responsive CopG/Arc/MetJ family transcriptional regulator
MTRINRRIQGESRNTISVTLPHDCVIILNRAMNRYGNNRSLAVEYIIKDWERARQAEREARQ